MKNNVKMTAKSIVVLGGGISGLSATWFLSKLATNSKIILLESTSYFGGWIRSYDIHHGGVMEAGPRSLRVAGPTAATTLSMLSELGLESSVLPVTSSHPAAKRRFIYLNNSGLVLLPHNLSWLFRTKVPFSGPLLGVLLKEPFRPRGGETGDESIGDFVLRRLGKDVADYLINPMCRGIYGGSSAELSIKSCFPQLFEYEKNHGSILRGMLLGKKGNVSIEESELREKALKEKWSIYSFRRGLQELPSALHDSSLKAGADLRPEVACTSLGFTNSGQAQVTTSSGEVITADHVISSLPSQSLSRLLPANLPTLRDELASIPSVHVAVMNVEYCGKDILPPQFAQSFGYLVPSHQKSNILGVVNDSASFPEHDRKDQPSTRLTVMMGGSWFEELFGQPEGTDENKLAEIGLSALREQLGILQDPSYCKVIIQKNCIPQYVVGHSKRLERIRDDISTKGLPLTLIGSSYDGVSVNDCIHQGLMAARNVTAGKQQ